MMRVAWLGILFGVLMGCHGPVPGAGCFEVPNGVNETYHTVCLVAVEEQK